MAALTVCSINAVVRALRLLAEDPALFLSLPVVLASNEERLDSERLVTAVQDLGLDQELGMVLSLTSEVSGRETFRAWAAACRRPAGGPPRYLLGTQGRYRRAGADANTPSVVADWGFRVNLPLSSFEQFFAKHHGGHA